MCMKTGVYALCQLSYTPAFTEMTGFEPATSSSIGITDSRPARHPPEPPLSKRL